MEMEGVAGFKLMVERHEPVPEHLGHDRGAGNGVAQAVALNDWPAGAGDRRSDVPIHQDDIGRFRKVEDGGAHGLERGLQDIAPVDLFGAREAESNLGMSQNDIECPRALKRRQPLGIVNPDGQPPAVQHDRGSHDRPGPRSAPRLIHARDAPEAGIAGGLVRALCRRGRESGRLRRRAQPVRRSFQHAPDSLR